MSVGGGLTRVPLACLCLGDGGFRRSVSEKEALLKTMALGWDHCIIRGNRVQHSFLELAHWHTGSVGGCVQIKSQATLGWELHTVFGKGEIWAGFSSPTL